MSLSCFVILGLKALHLYQPSVSWRTTCRSEGWFLCQMFVAVDYCLYPTLLETRRHSLYFSWAWTDNVPHLEYFHDLCCLCSQVAALFVWPRASVWWDVSVWRENGGLHVNNVSGEALGDADAQINADTLPVCAVEPEEWSVCQLQICLFPFTAVVNIPSGCYPKSSSLSHILSSSLPPLLFLYVPLSSTVCFSKFLKGEI